MGKAGGIIGLISGIFAVIAALITLLAGGIGAAFAADKAATIVSFGWYGLAASFLVIVAGAVAIFKPSVGAFGLLLLSLVGAVAGGTAVAICLALALLGGILAAIGSKDATGKRVWWQWSGLPLGLVIAITVSMQMAKPAPAIAATSPAQAVPAQVEPAPPAVVVAAPVAVEVVAEPSEQAEPLSTATAEHEAADKALNVAYKQAMARIDADGKTKLRTDQRAWIKQRDSECDALMGAARTIACQIEWAGTRTGELARL